MRTFFPFALAIECRTDDAEVRQMLDFLNDMPTVHATNAERAFLGLLEGAATGYKAFSVPVTYEKFGVKATKMKIMIASSAFTGSIDEESSHVVTFSDPVTSTSLGGKLWIDNLTFAY